MRNWSRTALEWNLASDSAFNPHTPGGCDNCKGGITVTSKNSFQRNVAYYIIAHASKFVSPGSLRISSIIPGNLNNVAFKTPAGKKVLLVANDGESSSTFNIMYNGKSAVVSMAAGSIASFIW